MYGHYNSCLAFMNFDGFLCEILFNLFDSFKNSSVVFILVMNAMLVFPIRAYFRSAKLRVANARDKDMVRLAFYALLFTVTSPAAVLPLAH